MASGLERNSMKVSLPKTKKWQKDIIDYYTENPKGKWIVCLSSRQLGKSVMIQILLTVASLKNNSSVSLYVAPILSQCRKVFNDILLFAGPVIKKSNAAILEITFINGSVIKFFSGQQTDGIRGETVKNGGILCLDESAFLKDDLFYDILLPTTNVFNSDILIVSTPKLKKGFFYELYSQGLLDDSKVISFNWCNGFYDTSEMLSKETLELYRKRLPATSFKSEYLGEFIDGDGLVFNNFKRCAGDYKLSKDKELYITIDWACGNGGNSDSTVLTFGQFDKKICISHQISFNDKKPTETIKFIKDIVYDYLNKGYRIINIIGEKNSIGNVYYSMLIQAINDLEEQWNRVVDWRDECEINVGTFLTTNESKKRMVERLELCFERDLIIIPNDPELLNQLSMFEATVNNNGTILYGVQKTEHDDRPLSLMILVDKLFNELEL